MSTNPAVTGIGASIVRTVVPLVVGALVTAFARVGVDLEADPETVVAVSSAATTIVGALYYAAVRLAETHLGPAFGWLLGYANAPRYDADDFSVKG